MIYFNIFNHFIKGDCLCLEYLMKKEFAQFVEKKKQVKN